MGVNLLQPSLAGGELAENLYGRVDVNRYQNGLALCSNFKVYPYGCVQNRSGFRYVGTVKDSTQRVRLVPFQWSQGQGYLLEMGNYYMRIWVNPTGASGGCGPLVVPAAGLAAWSSSTVNTAGAIVTYGGGAWISLQASNTGNLPAEGAWWHALPASGAGFLIEVPTPWPSTALFPVSASSPGIKWAQSADILTICHPAYPPQQIQRLGTYNWACIPFANVNGPWQDTNADPTQTVSVSAPTGNASNPVTVTASSPKVFANVSVGQLFYIQTQYYGTNWQVNVSHTVGDIVLSAGYFYRALSSGTTGTNQPVNASGTWYDGGVTWQYLGPPYGSILVTAIIDSTHIQGIPQGRLPDLTVMNVATTTYNITSVTIHTSINGDSVLTMNFSGPPTWTVGQSILLNLAFTDLYGNPQTWVGTCTVLANAAGAVQTNLESYLWNFAPGTVTGTGQLSQVSGGTQGQPTNVWAIGAWGGNQGYPSVVTFHQQRQVFANTPGQPQTVWMSQTGGYLNFGQNLPIQDSDAVTFTIASTQMNAITGFLPMQALVIFTAGGEWMCTGSNQLAITPSSLQLVLQGFRGSSLLPPVAVGNTALFIQNKGNQVRNLQYQFMTNTYAGDDITLWANHLFNGYTILDWCYQQIPDTTFWLIRDDGALLGLTYQLEQQVAAWHRHSTVGGTLESVCVVSEPPEDILYVLVNRTINGATLRTIERMNTRVVTDVKEAFFVDGGLSFEGRTQAMYPGANTAWGTPTMTFSGGTTWAKGDIVNLVCSIPAFNTGLNLTNPNAQVGDQVVFLGQDGTRYAATLLSITSTTQAVGQLNRELPAAYQGVPQAAWAWAPCSMGGLTNLIGQTVNILGEGFDLAPQVVSPAGTIPLSSQSYRVHAGLPITSQIQTLPANINQADAVLPKKKVIERVRILVDESYELWAGQDFNDLELYNQFTEGNPYDVPGLAHSGFADIRMTASWREEAVVCIQHTKPLPISVLAIIPEVAIGN